jgi:PhnB protein
MTQTGAFQRQPKEPTMHVNPYLFFDGNCEQAFTFYARVLGGKIEAMMAHAGTPAESQVPPEWKNKIIHARMTIGDSVLMASDAPPGRQSKPQGFSVSLQLKDPKEAERVFHALSDNGTVRMAFGKTFFSPGFGMLVDQFGIPWMVNTEQPQA